MSALRIGVIAYMVSCPLSKRYKGTLEIGVLTGRESSIREANSKQDELVLEIPASRMSCDLKDRLVFET